jgi:FG-GAP repeat
MNRTRTTLPLAAAVFGLALLQLPPPATAAGGAAIPSDFNGDGYADLAIGVPMEDVGSEYRAGAVNVLYGSRNGLTAAGDQYWTQDSPGVKGRSDGASSAMYGYGDEFGAALASGDFDGDGYADLAIGVPRDRVGPDHIRGGAVNVLYGSTRGLTAVGDQRWSQANLPGVPEKGDQFGNAVAAGDFDSDGYWDLAIGVRGEDPTGRVQLLYGGRDGLGTSRTAVLTSTSVPGSVPASPLPFGSALATGDLDGDGRADLAIGAPMDASGEVAVFYGTTTGITTVGSRRLPAAIGSPDPLEPGAFGWSLAIADFDADGFGDLAIGAPHGEECERPGRVVLARGSRDGITMDGLVVVPPFAGDGGAWYGCGFGRALATGDFNGDDYADLAASAVVYDTTESAGTVYVAHGGATGLATAAPRRWTQASSGIPGVSEVDDRFGWSLGAADFGRSGHADLAIGVPGESASQARGEWELGRVVVIYGTSAGLSGAGAQTWAQDTTGVLGNGEAWDQFGSILSP